MPKFEIKFSSTPPFWPGPGDLAEEKSRVVSASSKASTYEGAWEEARRIHFNQYQQHGSVADMVYWVERADLRVVLFSGPSCMGKGPLIRAVGEFYPDIEYGEIPVIKSKESRPGMKPRADEVHLWDDPRYFRHADEIARLSEDRLYLVGDCRGLPQALDTREFLRVEADLVVLEVYHTLGAQLMNNFSYGADISAVFISPISMSEVTDFKGQDYDLEEHVTRMMLEKQMARSKYQGKDVTDPAVQEDNRIRAEGAFSELESAHNYSHVIVNRDGEGHPNWNMAPDGRFIDRPIGDTMRAVGAFVEILKKGDSSLAEKWGYNTLRPRE